MVLSRLLKFRTNSLILMCLALSAGGVSPSAHAVELRVNFNVHREVESYVNQHGVKVDLQAPRVGNSYQWYQNNINGRGPLPTAAETQAQAILQGSALGDALAAEQARGHLVEKFVGSLKAAETALVEEEQRLNKEGGWAEWIVGSLGEKKDEIERALTDIRTRLERYHDYEDASKLLVANLEDKQRRTGTKGTQPKPQQPKRQQQQPQNNLQYNQLQKQLQTQQQQLQAQQQQLQQLQQQVQQQPQQPQTQQPQLTPTTQTNTSLPATQPQSQSQQPQNQSQQPQDQSQQQQTNPWWNTQWWPQPGPWGPPPFHHAPSQQPQSWYSPPQSNNTTQAQQQPQWGQHGPSGGQSGPGVSHGGGSEYYSYEDHTNSHHQGTHFSQTQPSHPSAFQQPQVHAQPQPNAHTSNLYPPHLGGSSSPSSANHTVSNSTVPGSNSTHHQHQQHQPGHAQYFPSQPSSNGSHFSQPGNSFSYPPVDQKLHQRLEAISSGLDELKQGQQHLQTHTQAIQELKQEQHRQTQMFQAYQQDLGQVQANLPDVAARAARTAANDVAHASVNTARDAAVQAVTILTRDIEDRTTRAATTAATRATADGVAVISERIDQLTQSQLQLQNMITEMQEQKAADVQSLQRHVHEYTRVVNENTRVVDELGRQQAQTNLAHQQQLVAYEEQIQEALQASRTATNAAGIATQAARAATDAIGEVADAAGANAAAQGIAAVMDGRLVPWMQYIEQLLEQKSGAYEQPLSPLSQSAHSDESKRDLQQVSHGDENDTFALEQARATFAEGMRMNGILYAQWVERHDLLMNLSNNGLNLNPINALNAIRWLEATRLRADAATHLYAPSADPNGDEQSVIEGRIRQIQKANAELQQILEELEIYRRPALEDLPSLLGQLAAEKHGAEAELERLGAVFQEVQRQKETAEGSLESSMAQIEELSAQNQELNSQNAALAEENEQQRNTVMEWVNSRKPKAQKLVDTAREKNKTASELQALHKKYETLKSHLVQQTAEQGRASLNQIEFEATKKALLEAENKTLRALWAERSKTMHSLLDLGALAGWAEDVRSWLESTPRSWDPQRQPDGASEITAASEDEKRPQLENIGEMQKQNAAMEQALADLENEFILPAQKELAERLKENTEDKKAVEKLARLRPAVEKLKGAFAVAHRDKERAIGGLRSLKAGVEKLTAEKESLLSRNAELARSGAKADEKAAEDLKRVTNDLQLAQERYGKEISAHERLRFRAVLLERIKYLRFLVTVISGVDEGESSQYLDSWLKGVKAYLEKTEPDLAPGRPSGRNITKDIEHEKKVSLELESYILQCEAEVLRLVQSGQLTEKENKKFIEGMSSGVLPKLKLVFQKRREALKDVPDLAQPHTALKSLSDLRSRIGGKHPEIWNVVLRGEELCKTFAYNKTMADRLRASIEQLARSPFTLGQIKEVVGQFEIPGTRFKGSSERVRITDDIRVPSLFVGKDEVSYSDIFVFPARAWLCAAPLPNSEFQPEDMHSLLMQRFSSPSIPSILETSENSHERENFRGRVSSLVGKSPIIRSLKAVYLLIALNERFESWKKRRSSDDFDDAQKLEWLKKSNSLLAAYSVTIEKDEADYLAKLAHSSSLIETKSTTASTAVSDSTPSAATTETRSALSAATTPSTTCSSNESHKTPSRHFEELKRSVPAILTPTDSQDDLDNHQSPPVSPKLRPAPVLSIEVPESTNPLTEPDFGGLPSGTSSLSVSPRSDYYISAPASPKPEAAISSVPAGSSSARVPMHSLSLTGPKQSQSKSQSGPFSFVPSPVKVYLYQPLKIDRESSN